MTSGERQANNANRAITNGLIALHIPVPLTAVQWADEYYYLPKGPPTHQKMGNIAVSGSNNECDG